MWYIQVGKTPCGIMAEKTIPKMESPLKMSSEIYLFIYLWFYNIFSRILMGGVSFVEKSS